MRYVEIDNNEQLRLLFYTVPDSKSALRTSHMRNTANCIPHMCINTVTSSMLVSRSVRNVAIPE
jgi:hypothetical protein